MTENVWIGMIVTGISETLSEMKWKKQCSAGSEWLSLK